MNPSFIPLPRGFSTAVFFFVSSLVGLGVASNAKMNTCEPKSCGSVQNISYPFWLNGEQPQYCGYPEFELQCTDYIPVLKISSQEFHVRKIFPENNSALLVDVEFAKDDCSIPRTNLSFDGTPFNISTSNKELFFYTDCTVPPADSTAIKCGSTEAFSHVGGDYMNPKKLASLTMCESVIIPVFGSAGEDGSNYTTLLKDGFLLDWVVTNCSQCKRSGGQCGYDTTAARFMCICADRNHLTDCTEKKVARNIIIGVTTGGAGFVGLCCCLFLFLYRRRKRQQQSSSLLLRSPSFGQSPNKDPEFGSAYYQTQNFTYRELQEATDGFDDSKELGDGGFGTVYKGKLRDGRTVAVKRLYENNYRRFEQFMNEIVILSRLRHQNLVTLYGCSSRHSRELLLVYEFVPNGTVADHLHGSHATEGSLTWPIRMNIAIETADALAYLHAIEPQIIHRDVKTNNILLDNGFHVKVADFGLSRLFPLDATHVSTAPQGTPGYVDPEYHQCYQLTDKSDVYSFGVVLIELISSKPAVDISRHRHEINLANLAVHKIQNRELDQLVDPGLGYESDSEVKSMITQVAELAFRCLQADGDMRPPIKEALEVLQGIQSGWKKAEKATDSDATTRNDTPLLKTAMPYSPDSVTDQWASRSTTSNASN